MTLCSSSLWYKDVTVDRVYIGDAYKSDIDSDFSYFNKTKENEPNNTMPSLPEPFSLSELFKIDNLILNNIY